MGVENAGFNPFSNEFIKEIKMVMLNRVQYITDENGEKTSVILPVETYEEIMEDIQDLVAIAERKNDNTISLDELKKSLVSDGLL